MKKVSFLLAFGLALAVPLMAQDNAQPTMGQLIGVNTVPGAHPRFLRQFSTIREFHEWGLDTGYDEDEANCDPDPVTCIGGGPIPNLNANCPVQKRYGWNPSYGRGAIVHYDELYDRFSGRFAPSLKSIAPEYRGLHTYPGFANIYEEKPICLGQAFTYQGIFPDEGITDMYPTFGEAQTKSATYSGYAEWATMFAIRFGSGTFGATDPIIGQFYLPRLLGGDPNFEACDFCRRHIEPPSFNLGDIKYMEIWNEQDQTWTDGSPIIHNLGAAASSFTRTFFYPHQYAAMLSAAYDGQLGTMTTPDGSNSPLGIKNVAANTIVVMGGTAGLRRDYVLGVMDWCNAERSGSTNAKLPFDVLNFHHYSSSGGQTTADELEKHNSIQFNSSGNGIMPETSLGTNVGDDLKNRLSTLIQEIKGAAQIMNPAFSGELSGKEWWLSEFGYDTEVPEDPQGSGILVPANIPNADREKVQAQWLTRSFLEISAAHHNEVTFINKAMVHTLMDPVPRPDIPTRQFDFSGLIASDGRPKRSWYYVLTLKYVLQNANFIAEGFSGGLSSNPPSGPSVKIYRYNDGQDIYAIWSPTASGTSFDMTINGNSSFSATLTEIKEWDANGRRTQAFANQSSIEVTVSETPVFLRMAPGTVDPVTSPVTNLTAQTLCCGAVLLSWNKPQNYRQYAIHYVKKNDVPAPSANGSFADFYNAVWPHLTFYNIEVPGAAKSVAVTGLADGTDYWFFVVPYDNLFNVPDFTATLLNQHYVGGLPNGCGTSGFCIEALSAGQLSFDQNACSVNWPGVQNTFGTSDTGNPCAKVNTEPPADQNVWVSPQNNQPICNTVTVNFLQVAGGPGRVIRAMYVRTLGAEGRLQVEYELCACPGEFIKGPIVTLPISDGSVLSEHSHLFPQLAIKRVRITRLDHAPLQRIFFCTKSMACVPGAVQPPTPPSYLAASDVTDRSALLTWEQSLLGDAVTGLAPVGEYEVKFGTSVVNGSIVNPVTRNATGDMELVEQALRLRDLQPGTTYYATVELDPPCGPRLNGGIVNFTTLGQSGGERSSGRKRPETQAEPAPKLVVLPNPNVGVFEAWLPSAGFERLDVLDLSGRLVHSERVSPTALSHPLSLSGLPAGMYLLRAFGSGKGHLPSALFSVQR